MRTTISMLSVAALVLSGVLTTDFGSAWAQTLPSCDFVTGGGFIIPDPATGAHGNFGVGGGCKNGSPTWGHLEYVDHGSGLAPTAPTPFNVHGTGVTGYFFIDQMTREISGRARTNDSNNSPVNYCVHVTDNGPGSTDIFQIQLTDTTTNGLLYDTGPHTLEGGNIELHKHNPSNTGSFSSGTCLVTGVSCSPPTPTNCNGTCTDTSSDPTNCGACGVTCNPQTQICLDGECGSPS
jgi:hypothetical protein